MMMVELDSGEFEEFFRRGESGACYDESHKSRTAHAIPDLDEAEEAAALRFTPEQEARRAKLKRLVTAIVASLGASSAILFTYHALRPTPVIDEEPVRSLSTGVAAARTERAAVPVWHRPEVPPAANNPPPVEVEALPPPPPELAEPAPPPPELAEPADSAPASLVCAPPQTGVVAAPLCAANGNPAPAAAGTQSPQPLAPDAEQVSLAEPLAALPSAPAERRSAPAERRLVKRSPARAPKKNRPVRSRPAAAPVRADASKLRPGTAPALGAASSAPRSEPLPEAASSAPRSEPLSGAASMPPAAASSSVVPEKPPSASFPDSD